MLAALHVVIIYLLYQQQHRGAHTKRNCNLCVTLMGCGLEIRILVVEKSRDCLLVTTATLSH